MENSYQKLIAEILRSREKKKQNKRHIFPSGLTLQIAFL